MSFRQTTVAGFPAIALRSAELEVVVVPAIGMRLTHLRRLRGREWLWRSDRLPLARPRAGASYRESAESGGWDECFPTIGASAIPGAPADAEPLPEHGELWSADWTSSVSEHADGTTLAGTAEGARLPYLFAREVTLLGDAPVMRLRYRLRNIGGSSFPWIWAAYSLFNVQAGSALELTGVGQVKLDEVHGRDDLSRNDVVSWPGGIGRGTDRFTFPPSGGWGVTLFGDLGAEGRMAVTDPRQGERLEILVDRAEVPQVRVAIEVGASKESGSRLGLAPCIGAPDRLDDAMVGWGTARLLAPGEERSWTVEVRLPDPLD